MKKYTINCKNWSRPSEIMAEPVIADEIFDALCDYYGIDSDDIERGYIQGDNGDIFTDGVGYENTDDDKLVELITITME